MTYHSSIRADDPSSDLPFEVLGFLPTRILQDQHDRATVGLIFRSTKRYLSLKHDHPYDPRVSKLLLSGLLCTAKQLHLCPKCPS
jgi:hypothetical protein